MKQVVFALVILSSAFAFAIGDFEMKSPTIEQVSCNIEYKDENGQLQKNLFLVDSLTGQGYTFVGENGKTIHVYLDNAYSDRNIAVVDLVIMPAGERHFTNGTNSLSLVLNAPAQQSKVAKRSFAIYGVHFDLSCKAYMPRIVNL